LPLVCFVARNIPTRSHENLLHRIGVSLEIRITNCSGVCFLPRAIRSSYQYGCSQLNWYRKGRARQNPPWQLFKPMI
jgi:hypothetical protein